MGGLPGPCSRAGRLTEAESEQPQIPEDAGGSSILRTYFTRADNTVVEEPFSGGCGQCLDRASDEKAEDQNVVSGTIRACFSGHSRNCE